MSLNNYKGNITILGGFKAATADPLMESHDILVGESTDGAEVRLDEQLDELKGKDNELSNEITQKCSALSDEIASMSSSFDEKLSNVVVGAVGVASAGMAGVVRIGENLSITEDGILSADAQPYDNATADNDGLMSAQDKQKLDGIEEATVSKAGLMSSEDKKKLDNIDQYITPQTVAYTPGLEYDIDLGGENQIPIGLVVEGAGQALGLDINIPSHVGGTPVTRIERAVFAGLPFNSISIPSTVLKIEGAFGQMSETTKLYLSNARAAAIDGTFTGFHGMTIVRADQPLTAPDIFLDCTSLARVEFSEGITHLRDRAMKGCTRLSHLVLPESLTVIGDEAFEGCTSLHTLRIPENVTMIGNRAFGYSNLSQLELSKPVSFGTEVFEGCDNLIIYANWWAGEYPSLIEKLKDVSFPVLQYDGIKAETSFEYKLLSDGTYSVGMLHKNMNSNYEIEYSDDVLNIPMVHPMDGKDVTTVADSGFRTENIWSVNIYQGVKSIGFSAFRDCKKMVALYLPNGLLTIEDSAFNGCSALVNVTIPNSVTSISSAAFANCSSLLRVNLSSRLESIEDGCFRNCSSLEGINIPYGCSKIKTSAFAGCTNLREVTIPASVTYLANTIFSGCTSLARIDYAGTKAQWDAMLAGSSGYWDTGLPSTCTIYDKNGTVIPREEA